ncbi:Ada metal-binding domain-containing protein [Desulfobacter curvatus]|uniref:Ada metal-binding domain-containing protein n=1 Tax=Desulfobacter curvatus TaxID=2290 RepID=UPI000378DE17|nr:Ada metal-binding domain-containing protein [Desulfobacter curvatus]
MKKFIIGALVLLVGVPVFAFTFFNFLIFLAGVIPVLMILGGAIAVYLGIEELKQSNDSVTTVEPEIQLGAERIEKNAEKQKKESETVLAKQEIEPEPKPIEKPEEAVKDEPDEQPEPETQKEAESPLTEPQQAVDPSEPEAEEPAAERVQFKGNIETLVFHTVECNFSSGKNCSMDFATKEAAEAQGYKPCKVCMPDI